MRAACCGSAGARGAELREEWPRVRASRLGGGTVRGQPCTGRGGGGLPETLWKRSDLSPMGQGDVQALLAELID